MINNLNLKLVSAEILKSSWLQMIE